MRIVGTMNLVSGAMFLGLFVLIRGAEYRNAIQTQGSGDAVQDLRRAAEDAARVGGVWRADMTAIWTENFQRLPFKY